MKSNVLLPPPVEEFNLVESLIKNKIPIAIVVAIVVALISFVGHFRNKKTEEEAAPAAPAAAGKCIVKKDELSSKYKFKDNSKLKLEYNLDKDGTINDIICNEPGFTSNTGFITIKCSDNGTYELDGCTPVQTNFLR